MRRWVVLVVVGSLACLSIGSSQAADATTTWSIMKGPSPAGSTFADLEGVSCPRTISCFAVGSSGHTLGVAKALVEHWNGHAWSIMPIPTPSGSTDSELFDIACPRPISCFAVGQSTRNRSSDQGLIEHWNGQHWSIMPSPEDAPGIGLGGVSCPRTISCFAVGSIGSRTLIEHWNGHTWSIMSRPNPASAYAGLGEVACPLPTSCVAVGSAWTATGNHNKTLIEHWNGHTWSIMPSPNRSHTNTDFLEGVSCIGPVSCFAVGFSVSDTRTFGATLVEYWNGLTWSLTKSPNRKGSTYSALYAVDCPSTHDCVSVGVSPGGQTFVQRDDPPFGGVIEASPNPKSNFANLDAIACPTPTDCFATGASQHGPLIEHGQ